MIKKISILLVLAGLSFACEAESFDDATFNQETNPETPNNGEEILTETN
ncbi:hypothetical protein M0D21_10780 [Aquimarina sp. D1M17]|nr:hypothetical protein [Aquimarina acroporae]MCK8522055.1 hypothetical protein [Aquimarina acroporae]